MDGQNQDQPWFHADYRCKNIFIYWCISVFVAINGDYPGLMSLKSNKQRVQNIHTQ